MKMEIWNGYKVYTVDAKDVEYIICDHVKKDDSEPTRSFKLPTKSFPVTVKFPIGGSKFLKLEKARIIQFPINNDLATTGHKLQGMTKKYLIVASLNYSTANWIYVVLSRVTTLNGLFLLQPLKNNFDFKLFTAAFVCFRAILKSLFCVGNHSRENRRYRGNLDYLLFFQKLRYPYRYKEIDLILQTNTPACEIDWDEQRIFLQKYHRFSVPILPPIS